MAKLPFSVSARTAKLIGQENFTTAEGAIVELVKNSYDADAKNCIVIFDNHDQAKGTAIYIVDNGVGMTRSDIESNWMKIGTDNKLHNFSSDSGRIKTGAKGIGRFALDRLGLKSEMFTVSKKQDLDGAGVYWSVTWEDFNKVGASVHEIEADIDEIANVNLAEMLNKKFSNISQIKDVVNSQEFTTGTILIIHPTKDNWDFTAIQKLFDNLEVLIPPEEQPDFKIHLFTTREISEFGEIKGSYYDDYDYKVSAKYLGDEEKSLIVEMTRKELDVNRLKLHHSEIFSFKNMQEWQYGLNVFEEERFQLSKTLDDLPGFSKIDPNLIKQIGAFGFTFYFLKLSNADDKDGVDYPYREFSSASRRAWMKKFNGVKIFRDDFRIRPYGEPGQDWLQLGERQAKSPSSAGQRLGGYRIGPNQIVGTISISRISNQNFQDKSGREGIQENAAFDLFKNILIEIIALFERDRNVVMSSISKLHHERNAAQIDRRKAKEAADRILIEAKNDSNKNKATQSGNNGPQDQHTETHSETEKLLARVVKHSEAELDEKNDEIRFLRGLASVGLIVSSFAHELKSLRTRLEPRSRHLINELKKHISPDAIKVGCIQDNPFYMLNIMRAEDIKLKHWLDYSLSSLKRDKRNRVNIDIAQYFHGFKSTWRQAIEQREVNLELKGPREPALLIRAFEVDLDAVFNNLLSNSLKALKLRPENRTISIDWIKHDEILNISFYDNGCGLAEEYMLQPSRVFEYNESSQRDSKGNKIGTGMGLYIAKMAICDYTGASIEITQVTGGFGVSIKLPLHKNK